MGDLQEQCRFGKARIRKIARCITSCRTNDDYWVLPPSGIPISCSTVQRLTNLEKKTEVWASKLEEFNKGLKAKFNAKSSDLKLDPNQIQAGKLLSLENEDEEFLTEYRRVISDEDLPHQEDKSMAWESGDN